MAVPAIRYILEESVHIVALTYFCTLYKCDAKGIGATLQRESIFLTCNFRQYKNFFKKVSVTRNK